MAASNMSHSFTSNSDMKNSASLAWRFAVFTLPLVAVVAIAEFALYRVGESWTWETVADIQAEHPGTIVSRSVFGQQFNLFKPYIMKRDTPSIIVAGSSRASKFRDIVFEPFQEDFYCAGNLLYELDDVMEFLSQLRSGELPRPRVLILIPDPWMFRENHWGSVSWLSDGSRNDVFNATAHVSAWRNLFWYMRSGFYPWAVLSDGTPSLTPLTNNLGIGMLAVSQNSGYRSDGTRIEMSEVRRFLYDDEGLVPAKTNFVCNIGGSKGYYEMSPVLVDTFITAIELLRETGTETYVILPPFSTVLHDTLFAHGMPRWWDNYFVDLKATLLSRGIPCISSPTPQTYGISEDFMLDLVHPSDVFAAYLVRDLATVVPDSSLLKHLTFSIVDSLRSQPWAIPVTLTPPEQWYDDATAWSFRDAQDD
jgi:hypothetical protein